MRSFSFMYFVHSSEPDFAQPKDWTVDISHDEALEITRRGESLHHYARAQAEREIMQVEIAHRLRLNDRKVMQFIGVNHLREYLTEEECVGYPVSHLADNPDRNDNPFDFVLSLEIIDSVFCDECGTPIEQTQAYFLPDGRPVCEVCLAENYIRCDGCGEFFLLEKVHETPSGLMLCQRCADEEHEPLL